MTKRHEQSTRDGEGGFTFIELVIAIVLSTMLLAALTTVLLTGIDGAGPTSQRARESNNAQVIAAFLVRDAQAAGGINPLTGLNDSSSGVFTNPLVTPAACTISATVLRFEWIDRTSATSANSTVDAVYSLSGAILTRTVCTTTVAGTTTASTTQLADSIASASAQCTTNGTTGACNNGSNGAQPMPDSVTLTLTATNNPQNAPTPYSYSLTANLRPPRIDASSGPGPTNSSPAALITEGASCPGVNVNNNATLKVYGDVLVNQGSGCVTVGNNGSLLYHSLTTSAGVPNPAFPSLQPPSIAGLPARAGCPGGVAQPGVYAAPLVLNNNSSCTFQSGIYILQSGLTLDNNSSMTTAAGGALFYLSGGAFSVDNNGSVNVQALSSGPYAGLALWQVSSTTINVNNNGTFTMAGTLYAPNAALYFNNNAVTPHISAVIVASATLNNNAAASFGPPPHALAVGATIPAAWTVGAPFGSVQVGASGGFGTYIYGLSGVNGLTINSSTGVINGAPTNTGNQTLKLTLDDSFGDPEAVATFPITINTAPTITTTSPMPGGNKNVAYSQTLTESNGTAPFTWSVSSGSLPAGLSLTNGVISGTPTTVATSNFTVMLTDAAGATASKALSITIGHPPTITSVSPVASDQGAVGQIITVTGTNFQTNAVVSFSGTGITVNSTTFIGVNTLKANVSITASATTGLGSVTETNPDGGTVTLPNAFTVNPPPTVATVSPCNVKKSKSFSFSMTAAGGTAPYAWSSPGFPAWGTTVSATGLVKGNAPASGSATFNVTVTDAAGVSATNSITLNSATATTCS